MSLQPHDPIARPAPADFLGHPRGLTVLFATETWERFSYFGNAALLVLYIVTFLLEPGKARFPRPGSWPSIR